MTHAATATSAQPVQALFVSTGLDAWETGVPACYARDPVINETLYRRLDPDYYAWLRSRMDRAKTHAHAGKMPQATYDVLRQRFNRVHQWAVTHFGEAALIQATQRLEPKRYLPPKASNTDAFQGILALPAHQRDWPPALRGIWHEVIEGLTRYDVPREEALTVAQDIVSTFIGTGQPVTPQVPSQTELPL